LRSIFGIAEFSIIAFPLLLIRKTCFLEIAIGFAFSVHDLFHQFILLPHLPLRNRRLSVLFVPKVCFDQHKVFNGVRCNTEEYTIEVTGSNPSLRTFLQFTGFDTLGVF